MSHVFFSKWKETPLQATFFFCFGSPGWETPGLQDVSLLGQIICSSVVPFGNVAVVQIVDLESRVFSPDSKLRKEVV